MPLSGEALGALLNACTAHIERPDYSIPDFHNVIEAHTAKDSAERTAWLNHIDPLTSAMGAKIELPAQSLRLNSPALAELILPEKKDEAGAPVVAETSQATTAEAENEEWDVDD
ncbi:hypothetical protein B0H11DRAFT_1928693 [Mycena galericulata]|nr:hypothetical protein B0H11DRAFT_1928693 [Mycena galericulata]